MKKAIISMAMACAFLIGCISVNTSVAAAVPEVQIIEWENLSFYRVNPDVISTNGFDGLSRATSRIEWNISAGAIMRADVVYPLEKGDLVTISCNYSPKSADVDFGLITQDGTFHFINGNNGNIQAAFQVDETGKYYFAVSNNSDSRVEVLGYVYY